MDDLEITKRCAERMGIDVWWNDYLKIHQYSRMDAADIHHYDPLHDDAQAMALVKKFGVAINRHNEGQHLIWMVSVNYTPRSYAEHPDNLNRAICECVAKLP